MKPYLLKGDSLNGVSYINKRLPFHLVDLLYIHPTKQFLGSNHRLMVSIKAYN